MLYNSHDNTDLAKTPIIELYNIFFLSKSLAFKRIFSLFEYLFLSYLVLG